MTIGLTLVTLFMVVMLVLITMEVGQRGSSSSLRDHLRFNRGPPDGDLSRPPPAFDDAGNLGSDVDPICTVFEVSELLAIDHLRGMDAAEAILQCLLEDVRIASRSHRRRPRPPTSILLHGPPGGAMTILAHELARGFRARLVQICATRALPSTNGGVQPKVAAAVNQARNHPPSVLVIDQLEHVAAASVRDSERLRAANDLLAESLRPVYGVSHVVVGIFTVYDDHPVPHRIDQLFAHAVAVDLPQLERALRAYALRTGDREVFRAIPGRRLAEHPDLAPPTWQSAS